MGGEWAGILYSIMFKNLIRKVQFSNIEVKFFPMLFIGNIFSSYKYLWFRVFT